MIALHILLRIHSRSSASLWRWLIGCHMFGRIRQAGRSGRSGSGMSGIVSSRRAHRYRLVEQRSYRLCYNELPSSSFLSNFISPGLLGQVEFSYAHNKSYANDVDCLSFLTHTLVKSQQQNLDKPFLLAQSSPVGMDYFLPPIIHDTVFTQLAANHLRAIVCVSLPSHSSLSLLQP
jgi:hypothetical protein